ncbi:MAG: SDR family oxidoreductase [Chloroflexi bacterium]|nr:SDR family oxidoreductase [Chloroflexota bacterium]
MDDLFSLKGQTAIVTGASYGLGVTFANVLAGAGANIVATARSIDKLEQTQHGIEAKGGKCVAIGCDVTDYAQVEAMTKQAADTFGRVDILVNNAGISDARGIRSERSDNDMFAQIVATDLVGLWHCSRAAAQYMLRQGKGNIINISSILGLGGFAPGTVPGYFAAKGGVNNLTKMLACEWGDRGVRVNALAPHFFDSEMTHEILVGSGFMQVLEDRTPMRRIGREADLAGPILFLASEASSFVNGVVLPIDGGLTAANGFGAPPFPSDLWDPEGRGAPLMPGTPWS